MSETEREAGRRYADLLLRAQACAAADARVAQAAARWADPVPTSSPTLKRLYQTLAHRERVYRKAGKKP